MEPDLQLSGPVLQEVSLFLSSLGGGVIATICTCVLQVPVLSPSSREEVMVHIFCTVGLLVLESRVPYPHQIVQNNASFHDDFDSGEVMLHGSQQNLEAVRQDSEGIFNHPPGACS